MMRSIVELSIYADSNYDIEILRTLILLYAFKGRNNNGKIEGISRYANLDFLLRYPLTLHKALNILDIKNIELKILPYEAHTIEVSFIKDIYEPFGNNFRKIISILKSKSLIQIYVEKNKTFIGITNSGIDLVNSFQKENDAFKNTFLRANIIKKNLGLFSNKKIMEIILDAL